MEVGASIRITDGSRIIAQGFHFDTTKTIIWRPPPIPKNWNNDTLRAGLCALRQLISEQLPTAGLVQLILDDQDYLSEQACSGRDGLHDLGSAQFRTVHRALSVSSGEANNGALLVDNNAICNLVGIGAGLTPSGDDFIGGLLLALRTAGYQEVSDSIREAVLPAARIATNKISLEHLKCASLGLASNSVHEFLIAILLGRDHDIVRLADDIDQIGHTSGWDIAAGMVCALEVILSHRDRTFK